MHDIDALIEANRAAVETLLTAAEAAEAEGRWGTPRAEGKWSPQQVVEHVAMALEEGGHVISGTPTKLPTLPFFVRPLAKMFFNRVVKTGKFPKAKTNKDMDPARAPARCPATSEEARKRLDAAFAEFERACRARAASGDPVPSGAFGNVPVEDYARFTELHTLHHAAQVGATT